MAAGLAGTATRRIHVHSVERVDNAKACISGRFDNITVGDLVKGNLYTQNARNNEKQKPVRAEEGWEG